MNEDFCSYELSKALKACGFDEPCHYHYDCDRGSHIIEPNYTTNDGEDCQYITADDLLEDNNGWQYCSAPTLAHAQKWLREKYGLHVVGLPCMDSASDTDGQVCDEWQFWFFDIMQVSTARFLVNGEGRFDSYEQALTEGIKSCVENLLK